MLVPEIYREKSPLSEKDCFVVFDRRKSSFTFPVHIHPEYELNFVDGAPGAQRIIGDSLETIGEKDLVLIASGDLKHAWKDGKCTSTNIHEITIQFHPHLFEHYLNKNQFSSIKRLFERGARGLCFGTATIEKVQPLLQIITMESDGFYSVMRLFTLLHELSKSEDCRELSSGTIPELSRNAELLKTLHELVSSHITENLLIADVASRLNMSRSTFARFIKLHTGVNFSDYVLQCRINMAMLKLKGADPIQHVADECGFNSLSYFYRVFKKAKGITPAEFRNNYNRQHVIV